MLRNMRKKGFQAPGLVAPETSGSESARGVVMKGRGATANPPSRFLLRHSEAVGDGWSLDPEDDDRASSAPEVATELYPDRTQSLITRNRSPDIPFDRSINPYKGCEHGCVYCFARPTHAYLDLSPGIDFETRIFYKTRVRETLIEELSRPGYLCRAIAMGTNTDPYQPAERERQVTRRVLEVLLDCRHPVTIVTKGQLILRDLDVLAALAELGLVSVAVSLTTLDNALKTRLEPRAAGPAARLRVIERLADAGVPTGVMVAPIIPFINDHEIEAMVAAAAEAGAREAAYILLRLPLEVKDLFRAWLDAHYPLKAGRVMSAIRGARGGKDYDAAWGRRMRGEGAIAELIGRRFAAAVKRHGLGGGVRPALRTDLFQPPGVRQMGLF
jgi:DNA repair photolyase